MTIYVEIPHSINFIQQEWPMLTLILISFCVYYYFTSTFNFFKMKGVPYMKPNILFGNVSSRVFGRKSFLDFQLDVYNYFKGNQYGGIFEGRRPVMIILDTELIKAITMRDFEHFVDRNTITMRVPSYLKQCLLILKGSAWKEVRSTLSPTFSSARLKNMLPLIEQCSNQMIEYLKQYDTQDVEMKDTIGHFTLEVIGVCAFGIKCDSLSDENAYFIKVAEKFDYMSKTKRFFIFFVLMLMPEMIKYLNISFLDDKTTNELLRMLQAVKTERRTSGIKRNDFLQLLIDAVDKTRTDPEHSKHLDENTIDAQSLLFLIAGYETTSTLLSFAIHMLAVKPEVQTKLRDHIKELTYGKEINYELLNDLPYLDGVLLETLRMYPPICRVDRVCTKPYTLPGTSVHLNVGDVVAIPVYGIHMDCDIYKDPQEFIPERFMFGEKMNRPSHLYLAFGVGPRNCIGIRFAMITAKLAMVSLLKNFKFSACSNTEDPIKFDKRAVLLKSSKGCWVRVEKI